MSRGEIAGWDGAGSQGGLWWIGVGTGHAKRWRWLVGGCLGCSVAPGDVAGTFCEKQTRECHIVPGTEL